MISAFPLAADKAISGLSSILWTLPLAESDDLQALASLPTTLTTLTRGEFISQHLAERGSYYECVKSERSCNVIRGPREASSKSEMCHPTAGHKSFGERRPLAVANSMRSEGSSTGGRRPSTERQRPSMTVNVVNWLSVFWLFSSLVSASKRRRLVCQF